MNPEIRKQYADFLASPAGEHFISTLDTLIDENHRNAELHPDNSRDYTQRAKGVREAKDQIVSSSVQLKEKEKRVR